VGVENVELETLSHIKLSFMILRIKWGKLLRMYPRLFKEHLSEESMNVICYVVIDLVQLVQKYLMNMSDGTVLRNLGMP
jgi:hypothetical protein